MPRLITLKRDESAMMLQAMTASARPSLIGDDTSSVNPDYMRYPLHYHPVQTPHEETPAGMGRRSAFPSRDGRTREQGKKRSAKHDPEKPEMTSPTVDDPKRRCGPLPYRDRSNGLRQRFNVGYQCLK